MTREAKPAIASALIIGGGIAGMSAALTLADSVERVHLIDSDPEWKVYGAGITITGPTLRVMKRLGILEKVMELGWTADGILACDQTGAIVASIETGSDALDGLPGAGGIMRPTLHRLLAERLRATDVKVSLGLSVRDMGEGQPKKVTFSDGSTGEYDLVVGADGIFSTTREIVFPGAPAPNYVGQVCWRLMSKRHPDIDRRTYFLGGPVKVGMNPVSPDSMYMFLLEPVKEFERVPDDQLHIRLGELMAPYGGVVADVRAGLCADSNIVARPLETVLAPSPWYRDGVVLIGDAAHATTPQLASGAGMAMEDGVVLGDCIAAAETLEAALAAFIARRFDRCSLVVENSLKLGELERAGAAPLDQIRVVETALAKLNEPY